MCLGVPARVVEITDAVRCLAKVEIAGVRREVSLACIVDDAHPLLGCVGDWVLIHVGFALARIDEAQAQASLLLLRELVELDPPNPLEPPDPPDRSKP